MKTIILTMSVFLLSGCIATMQVTKVTNENEESVQGQKYSLPLTYLVLTPKEDGTMEHRIEYLPDPNNTYAVNAKSYLASHTLTVGVDDRGLLDKIVWNKDTTGVASSLAKAYGDIEKAKIAKEQADEKKAQDASKNNKSIDQQISEAKLALERAKEIEGALEDVNNGDLYAQAIIDVIDARLKYESLINESDTADKIQGLDVNNGDNKTKRFNEVYGPIWYEIQQSKDSVALVEAFEQYQYGTINVSEISECVSFNVQPFALDNEDVIDDGGISLTFNPHKIRKTTALRVKKSGEKWAFNDAWELDEDNGDDYKTDMFLKIDLDKVEADEYLVWFLADLEKVEGDAGCVTGNVKIVEP